MNKKFTDIFINKPVLATVVSLLIFIVGLRSMMDMQVRQFPKVENTVVTVTTSYPGASPDVVAGFITTPLEQAIASAEGMDYMTSQSTQGTSTITAYIKLNYSPNAAFTNVMSKVQQALNVLPPEAQQPVIDKSTGSTTALMYIGFSSKVMSPEQITEYITRVVQPKLETVFGVSQAQILGAKNYSMRIWLNTPKMAGMGITPNDIFSALQNNNYISAAGNTKGEYTEISINPQTDLHTAEAFGNIVVRTGKQGGLVYLRDVARVVLGADDYDSSVYFNGKPAVFVAITSTPSANPLTVIDNVKKLLPGLQAVYPPGLDSKVVYDATTYIRASIDEVIETILEATIIVIAVIFLFLGSLRTVTIPIVTIPLSLVGVCTLMLALGYSINLLTLLAMVLAIGMVVDDAIVVVENCYRHIEEGLSPKDAAIKGAREIAMPVISMTLTLAAVYAPIGFMGGITGALFKEFAFTLACSVIVSGIIALTLSPMMCSKVLSSKIADVKMVQFVDKRFARLKNLYERLLTDVLNFKPVVLVFAFVVLLSCMFLYMNTQSELAPQEDQGVVFVSATGPQSASLHYMETFTKEFTKIYKAIPATSDFFVVNGMGTVNSVISGLILKPWGDRKASQQQVNKRLQKSLNGLPGLQIQAFSLPPLPVGGSPIPIQFVVSSIGSYQNLYLVTEQLIKKAQASGLFLFIDSSLKFDNPELDLTINRDKAAQLGIGTEQIGQALSTALGGNYVNYFSIQGRSYKVIPQVMQRFRENPDEISQIYVKTASGDLVPLSTVLVPSYKVEPNALTRFNQLNSTTLSGMMMPGQTLGTGLDFLMAQSKKLFPKDMSYDFAGQSRQYIEEGDALLYTFMFSIIVIFLVLAAQFESFRDPLVVMTSVPMAICGALLPLNWGLASVNIYTQIGLITLIGLISKHGILMVEFANKLQEGDNALSPHEAIIQAAAIRLRPVLMTTFSMILGVVPLLIATGAGAVSRFDIGLVIAMGMFIGTLFTLFVVPTMYSLKAKTILLFLLFVGAVAALLYFFFYILL